jgi:hypothetical protein
MPFNITVQNDGEDGTVDVNEQINNNEFIQVFTGFIEAGGQRQVACQGAPPKDFTWLHHATNTGGGPTTCGDGDVLRVQS